MRCHFPSVFRPPGESRHSGSAARGPPRGHQQGALQRSVCGVGHRALGLARGLAAALHASHGHARQRGRERRARGHACPHRCWHPPAIALLHLRPLTAAPSTFPVTLRVYRSAFIVCVSLYATSAGNTMAFLSPEFTREVTDTQMPLVAPVILPEMYKIFTMAEVQLL